MCFGMGGSATTTEKKPKFSNAPPVVTGKQTGVENPKEIAFNDFMFITPCNEEVQASYRKATSGLVTLS